MTLSLSDENFGKLVTGKTKAQSLFMSGKLKIKGNVMKGKKQKLVDKYYSVFRETDGWNSYKDGTYPRKGQSPGETVNEMQIISYGHFGCRRKTMSDVLEYKKYRYWPLLALSISTTLPCTSQSLLCLDLCYLGPLTCFGRLCICRVSLNYDYIDASSRCSEWVAPSVSVALSGICCLLL